MSTLITEAFVQQYRSNVQMLYQQQGAKLRGSVRVEPVTGKQAFFERLGATAAVKRTTRHGDTPLVNSAHSRRMVVLTDYEWADLVDQFDKVRLLISPESDYAQNAAWALGRATDDEIITAFGGNAFSGETGQTTVPLPAAQKIASGATGLTLVKILQAKKILDNADVPQEDRWFVASPDGLEDLLNNTTVTSSDFNTIKALVRGELNAWVGFTWIISTRLPKAGATRSSYAWHRRAMGLAMGKDISGRITERADKSYSVQVYNSMILGATRIEDEGVVEVAYDE